MTLAIPAAGVSAVTPLPAPAATHPEICPSPETNNLTTPIFNVGAFVSGQSYWAHVDWSTNCDSYYDILILRRVTIRVPYHHSVIGYYWVSHSGTHETQFCSIDTQSDPNRPAVVCELNEIDGTGQTGSSLYVNALPNNTGGCNHGDQWWASLRYHYSPYAVVANTNAWIAHNCGPGDPG